MLDALTKKVEQFKQIAQAYREDATNGGPNVEGKRISEMLAKAFEHVVKELQDMPNVDANQVIAVAGALVPAILDFVKAHQAQTGQPVPTEEEVNAHIAARADALVDEIERMQREHPRTT